MNYEKNFYSIKSNDTILEYLKDEIKYIGYYALPYQDTSKIKEFAKTVHQKHIAVVGIGGSTLGTYAVYNFLNKTNEYEKSLHFFESTDPTDITSQIKSIDINDTYFLIISKSGTTIETISIFKYLSSLVKMSSLNCAVISEDDSKLTKFARLNQLKTFEIPKNVGGRFSVLCNVGLVPLAILGIDIDKLLLGAKDISESFFNKKDQYPQIMEKARFIVENKHRFNINVIFSYSASLEGFNKWYIQLWGESLGKINTTGSREALTPIGLIGPVDQHSFLQLIAQGRRDKTVTFIKVADFHNDTKIPAKTLKGFEDLEYIDNITFAKLIDEQANSTIKAIKELNDIPFDIINLERQDEYNIAKLMFFYMLLTSAVGKFLQIDTYDQPGVEDGKVILKEKLNNL